MVISAERSQTVEELVVGRTSMKLAKGDCSTGIAWMLVTMVWIAGCEMSHSAATRSVHPEKNERKTASTMMTR